MRRKTPCLLLPLLALLAACGGSGSSGFSVTPLEEEAAITEVLDTGRCSEIDGLEICPASDTLGQIPGQPSDGPVVSEGSHVVFNLPPDDALSCEPSPSASGCLLTLSFAATGKPPESVYQIAVRQVEPDVGAWIVDDQVSADPYFQASLEVPGGATAVQIAVLVFADTGVQPGLVEGLSQTGASTAFVSDALQVGLSSE